MRERGSERFVGWVLATWAHGRGFATEAVGAALAWSDAHLPYLQRESARPRRTVCLIAPENATSVRVAEKCGFREAAPATSKGTETLVFERSAARVVPKLQ